MMTLDEGGWRRSRERTIAAPPSIRDIVELFWIDEWSQAESAGRTCRIVADDAPHVLWHFVGSGSRLTTQRLTLVGSRSAYYDVDLSGRRMLIGARLRPGALPLLVRQPAAQFTNRSVLLKDIVSPSTARAGRQMDPATPEASVHALAELIAGLRRRRPALDARAEWIARLGRTESTSVATLARLFGMSPRSVRAWSAATLGMGLKRLLKIRRLHAALEMQMSGVCATWSQAAAAAGYADQPHLIRDCRALLGESPAAFVERGARAHCRFVQASEMDG